jgi:beta-lactam-binding protein with PASTA domain
MKLKNEASSLKRLLIHIGVIMGLFCLLSFTVFYKVLPWVANKNKIVTVPDLKGMSIDEAAKFIRDRDLEIEVIDSSFNAEVAPLIVLQQFPKPNAKVKIKRKITLILNARIPPTVSYPDLTNSTFDLAQKQLQSQDLKIGTIQYRVDIAHNAILESRINGRKISSGEQVSKGSKVDLVIGNQTDKFPLPDLTGMEIDEANAYILGMNLNVKEIHYLKDGTGELNTIQKQLPEPGDTVRIGDEVELWTLKSEE